MQPGGPGPKSAEDHYRDGLKYKEEGNQAYKDGRFADAIDRWCFARGSMKHILERGHYKDNLEKEYDIRQALLTVHLNLAQGCLKNEEFHQAIQHCSRALDIDPRSSKALYRQASGQLMGSLFADARCTLGQLLQLEPANLGARQILQEVERKEHQATRSSKKVAQVAGMERDPRVDVSFFQEVSERVAMCLSCRMCRRRSKTQ